jgi:hypothetical protein
MDDGVWKRQQPRLSTRGWMSWAFTIAAAAVLLEARFDAAAGSGHLGIDCSDQLGELIVRKRRGALGDVGSTHANSITVYELIL